MRTSFTLDFVDIARKIKSFIKRSITFTQKHQSIQYIAATLIAILLWAGLIQPTFFPQTLSDGYTLKNIGKLSAAEGIGIYWDVTATRPATQIDWGIIQIADERQVMIDCMVYDADIAQEFQIWVNGIQAFVTPVEANGAMNNQWQRITRDISQYIQDGSNYILIRGAGGGAGSTVTNITISQDGDIELLIDMGSYPILDTSQVYEANIVTVPVSYGGVATANLYIRNEGDTPTYLNMTDWGWNPSNLTDYANVTWNFGTSPLGVDRIRRVIFQLQFPSTLPSGFSNFEFNMTVTKVTLVA